MLNKLKKDLMALRNIKIKERENIEKTTKSQFIPLLKMSNKMAMLKKLNKRLGLKRMKTEKVNGKININNIKLLKLQLKPN